MNSATSSSTSVHFGHQGRVVIVTGGAQGIGEACVRRFAQEGAKVVIADVADALGRTLAIELGALYRHCDVGDKVDVDDLVAKVMARTRPVPTSGRRPRRRPRTARRRRAGRACGAHQRHRPGQHSQPHTHAPPGRAR